jgi:DNA-binding winged helix-turn-helix (wHTH) protein
MTDNNIVSPRYRVALIISDDILRDSVSALLECDYTVTEDRSASVVITDSPDAVEGIPTERIIIIGEGGACRVRFSRPFEYDALSRAVKMISDESSAENAGSGLTFDAATRSISKGEVTVKLSDAEFRLLSLLMSRRGNTVDREEASAEVFGGSDNKKIYDVYVCYLRKKLRPVMGDGVILPVRGKGYMIRRDIFSSENE